MKNSYESILRVKENAKFACFIYSDAKSGEIREEVVEFAKVCGLTILCGKIDEIFQRGVDEVVKKSVYISTPYLALKLKTHQRKKSWLFVSSVTDEDEIKNLLM